MQVEELTYNVEKFNGQNKITNKPEDNLYSCVKNAIKKIIEDVEFTKYKVKIRALEPDGGNYLANLYEIDILDEAPNGKKKINLFVKQTVCADNLYGFIDIEDAYLKEVFFYTDVSVILDKLQNEANIPSNERFRNVKCWPESGVEAIIMENLAKQGFKTPCRKEITDLKFAQLSIQQIARFHSLSFVIQKKMPEYFEKKIRNLKSVLHLNDKYIEICTKSTKAAISHYDEDIRKEIMNDLPGLIDTFFKYLNEAVTSANCLCHGDYRLNNILGKEEDGETTEVLAIDYQLIFYGPPVTDIIYFMYTSGHTQFRENHERDLKDLYRDTMKDSLKHYDIDIEDVFPTKVFEKDYEFMRDFGFFCSFVFIPIFYSESIVLEPGSDLLKQDICVDKSFPERMAGLYDEYKRFKNQKYNKN
ncbi:uncharacterized protein LOC123714964 [Pieris brassicae]|uniref:uncharacterized protein LOC123714964 n=1 Tax=Pieris brassicae TaxID=7116 RepID=UPI001E65FB33|nr:uncharacterized protein LOC123714964 [Pieris brassicae]